MMMMPQNTMPQFQPAQMRQPQFPKRPSQPSGQWQGTPRKPRRPILRNPIAKRKEAPKQVFRMQSPDPEPAQRARLQLPTPENLGLAAGETKTDVALDWNAVWSRLKAMKAVGFRVANLDDGQVRVTFILPTGETKRHFQIEVTGPDEAHAVHAALARAEQWAHNGP